METFLCRGKKVLFGDVVAQSVAMGSYGGFGGSCIFKKSKSSSFFGPREVRISREPCDFSLNGPQCSLVVKKFVKGDKFLSAVGSHLSKVVSSPQLFNQVGSRRSNIKGSVFALTLEGVERVAEEVESRAPCSYNQQKLIKLQALAHPWFL